MDGIEERIAELLSERTEMETSSLQGQVDEVLEIMGHPRSLKIFRTKRPAVLMILRQIPENPKRLYRDTEHRVIGGVCSGLAAYFNIDTILVRVLLIALVLGSSAFKYAMFNDHLHNITFSLSGLLVLVYIAMWIIVPAARSV
jgi:phage shock protein PspC (stress-responsive transcriptional regulator)